VAHLPSVRSGSPLHWGLSIAFASWAVLAACGAPDERPPPAESEADLDVADLTRYDAATADARDVFSSGGCEDGETKTCRIYLPQHDGVQPCFVGEQVCANSAWGTCGSAVLVDANANDAQIEADAIAP
jgi:hypothetical protein